METVLNKLSEIEAAATQIMEAAASEKKELEQQMQKQIADFDRMLEEKTAERVEHSKKKLNNAKEKELSDLKSDNRKLLEELETYYQKNRKKLSSEIFNELIRM